MKTSLFLGFQVYEAKTCTRKALVSYRWMVTVFFIFADLIKNLYLVHAHVSQDKLMIPPVIIICHWASLMESLTSTQFQYKMWMPRLYGNCFSVSNISLMSFMVERMDLIFCTLHQVSVGIIWKVNNTGWTSPILNNDFWKLAKLAL